MAAVRLGFAQRQFGALALGDLEGGAGHVGGAAVRAPHGLALGMEPAPVSFGVARAELQVVRPAPRQMRAHGGAEAPEIIGVHQRLEARHRGRSRRRVDAQLAPERGGKFVFASAHVPVPHLAQRGGKPVLLFAQTQRLLGPPALGDVGEVEIDMPSPEG